MVPSRDFIDQPILNFVVALFCPFLRLGLHVHMVTSEQCLEAMNSPYAPSFAVKTGLLHTTQDLRPPQSLSFSLFRASTAWSKSAS